MKKRKSSSASMGAVRGISLNALFKWQNANLGFTLLGLFYLLFPWFASGAFDTVTAIFGMMFLSVGILRAKVSVSVLGALCAAFLGICYFFGTIAFLETSLLWALTVILFIAFLIFELNFFKLGPTTKSAKAFILVPLSLLSFSLILAFLQQNPMLNIDWAQPFVAVNYLAVLLFSLTGLLGVAGWRVMGASTDKWILLFAIAAIATAVLGIYQGTLFQWT